MAAGKASDTLRPTAWELGPAPRKEDDPADGPRRDGPQDHPGLGHPVPAEPAASHPGQNTADMQHHQACHPNPERLTRGLPGSLAPPF